MAETSKGKLVGGGTLSSTATPSKEKGKTYQASSIDATIAKGVKAVASGVKSVAKGVGEAFSKGAQTKELSWGYGGYDPEDYKDSGTQANHTVTKVDRKTGKATK